MRAGVSGITAMSSKSRRNGAISQGGTSTGADEAITSGKIISQQHSRRPVEAQAASNRANSTHVRPWARALRTTPPMAPPLLGRRCGVRRRSRIGGRLTPAGRLLVQILHDLLVAHRRIFDAARGHLELG